MVDSRQQRQALFQDILEQAALDGEPLLLEVLSAVRRKLEESALHAPNVIEQDQHRLSLKLLDSKGKALAERFTPLLRDNFHKKRRLDSQFASLAKDEWHYGQLQGMNVGQAQEQMALTCILQMSTHTTEAALAELNAYICALLNLSTIRPERNPLRPLVYVTSLQELLMQASVPLQIRTDWIHHVPVALGKALLALYTGLNTYLREQGVMPVIAAKADGHANAAPELPSQSQHVLDGMRSLLAKEMSSAATQQAHPSTKFDTTMPTAFNTPTERQQIDQRVASIEKRPTPDVTLQDSAPDVIRQQLMLEYRHTSQALNLEVVSLMVENLVRDTRLLEPIRRVIENLEPALLRLVLVDPCFFSDNHHPARQLLFELTQRGLAFGSVETPEFGAFLMSLYRCVVPLSKQHILDAGPFELALNNMHAMWKADFGQYKHNDQKDSAVKVLQEAEVRHLIARKMVSALEQLPELHRVPSSVAEFLCGPWAQVMAFAEMQHGTDTDDPGHYKELVNVLLWSAQPNLTCSNVAKLTKLVPRLLSKLREGLKLIDYPSVKTSDFFDILLKLHEQAFKPARTHDDATPVKPAQGLTTSLTSPQDHWVAPAEVKVSGFMDFQDDDTSTDAKSAPQDPTPSAPTVLPAVGHWVEMWVKDAWLRTQLTWISPQSTMFLFTSVHGQTQSMTRRSLDKMLANNTLHILAEQSMVDSVLDKVVQQAIRNSLDSKLG
jgi:hypothetical protein